MYDKYTYNIYIYIYLSFMVAEREFNAVATLKSGQRISWCAKMGLQTSQGL